MDIIDHLKGFLGISTLPGDAEDAANDTDDAALQSHTRALPPLPFSQGSPTSSDQLAATTIDLTSPTRRSRAEPRGKHADKDHSRLTLKKQRSNDEKRLVADYHIPGDRVEAPHPASYFLPPATMVKPGSGKGFIPMNTLDGVSIGPGGTKPVTYSKFSRQTPGPIGRVRGAGQQEFERVRVRNPATPARKTPSRQDPASHSREGVLSKRRKTEHVSSPNFVDLVGDDEVQEVAGMPAPVTPSTRRYDLPRSSHSSRSQPTLGDRYPAQPMSEFQAVEKMANPRRNRVKSSSSHQTQGAYHKPRFDRTVSGSITPRHQDAPVHVIDDEPAAPAEPARKSILQNFKQGVSANTNNPSTSPYFPNARINESTTDVEGQTPNAMNEASASKDLRNFRRAQDPPVGPNPIGDNELQLIMPNDTESKGSMRQSPGNPAHVTSRGAKRKATKKHDASIAWPLLFARTHGFKLHSEDVQGDLQLRQRGDEWEVGVLDSASGAFDVKTQMNPQHINRVLADDVGCIRLEGPRRQDGNRPTFDFTFAEAGDFYTFRDNHAVSFSIRHRILRQEEKTMALLFHRDLLKNDKVGTSPLIDDTLPTGDEPKKKNGARSTDSALWNLLSAKTKQDNENSTTNGNDRASNRPTRSTRSTAPVLDSEGTPKDYEVEKYSVRNGLGPRWHRPLTYGGGPKATVFFEDLPRLDEEELLNDNIIDFSMIYLFEKSNIPRNKVFFFNTFFFTKLTEKTGRNSIDYKAVQKWTSKVDIFLYDYIVVPINEQTHWYLAIICNVGNIARRPVEEDFGETAATKVADDEHVRSDPNGAADMQATPDPPPVDPPQVSTPQQCASDQEVEDVNLFDEDSKLDIIDPEATGSEQQVPLPSIDLCLTQTTDVAAANAVDAGSAPRTVLSNLNASPAKKKSQRKFKGQKRDPNVPIIMILDSLSTTRSGTVRALKDWLAAEGKARRGMEATIKEHGFYPKSDQIPTQKNWTDCGVYLLGYAEKFFADPDEFKNKLLTGEMTADEDWPQLKPKEMRNNLRDIILALAEEQKLTEEKKKKKKGKKVTAADKSSPPGHVSQSGDVHPPSPPEQSHETRPEILRANVEVSVQEPGVNEPVKEQPNELPTPRLGSPIVFKRRNSQTEVDAHPSAVVAQVSGIASRSLSPSKGATTSPGLKHALGRKASPEVRIPMKTSPSKTYPQKDQQGDGNGNTNAALRETQLGANSANLGKRTRTAVEDDGELRMPPKKKQASESPPNPERTSPNRISPLPPPPEGHSDHPIEIADSQELKPLATQSPRRLHTSSPAQRRQPSRSPRKVQSLHHAPSVEEIPRPSPRKTQALHHAPSVEEIPRPSPRKIQVLHHAPSVEEIPRPSPRATQRKHGQPEDAIVGHQLEASLDEGIARKRLESAKASSPTSASALERAEDSEPEPMDVDSQGADPMDTADDVVNETPSPRRSSPPPLSKQDWVKGDELRL